MNTYHLGCIGLVLACLLPGCVTAHEGTTQLHLRDHIDNQPVPDAYVLTITSQAIEKEGHWWMAQRSEAGMVVPKAARVVKLADGGSLHQEGYTLALLGPYAYGQNATWEYWVVRPGYDPQRFYDTHFERAYKEDQPLEVTLSRLTPGSTYSDERVLAAARRFSEVADLLESNPSAAGLLQTLSVQLKKVQETSWKGDDREEADRLLTELASQQKHLAAVQVAELTPRPSVQAAPAATAPPAAENETLQPVATEDLTPPADGPVTIELAEPTGPPDTPETAEPAGPAPVVIDLPPLPPDTEPAESDVVMPQLDGQDE